MSKIVGFILIISVQVLIVHSISHESLRYSFKEYSYVALPKYVSANRPKQLLVYVIKVVPCHFVGFQIVQETQYQEFQSACQQSPSCHLLEGVDQVNCIRECISPSCFIELYQNDKVFLLLYTTWSTAFAVLMKQFHVLSSFVCSWSWEKWTYGWIRSKVASYNEAIGVRESLLRS